MPDKKNKLVVNINRLKYKYEQLYREYGTSAMPQRYAQFAVVVR